MKGRFKAPSETYSLIVQATISCAITAPSATCIGEKFRVGNKRVINDLKTGPPQYPRVDRIFADGDVSPSPTLNWRKY